MRDNKTLKEVLVVVLILSNILYIILMDCKIFKKNAKDGMGRSFSFCT